MKNPRLLPFRKERGRLSGYQRRFDEREARLAAGGGTRCPDCNAVLVSARAIGSHKARGGCVVIPGVRERLADRLVAYFLGVR